MKYYGLRNRSVLVLCPKKLADNWLTYKGNLVTNIFMKDRFGYDVLSHTEARRSLRPMPFAARDERAVLRSGTGVVERVKGRPKDRAAQQPPVNAWSQIRS
jgi:hypothetical protein